MTIPKVCVGKTVLVVTESEPLERQAAVVTKLYEDGVTVDLMVLPPGGAIPVPLVGVPALTSTTAAINPIPLPFWAFTEGDKPKVPKLRVGLSIAYTTTRGDVYAALVTHVHGRARNEDPILIDVVSFPPGVGTPPSQHRNVPMREHDGQAGTWWFHPPD